MAFKTRANRYLLDAAPTGRARCRGCKNIIEKGSPRLVNHAFVRPGRGTKFARHVRCIDKALAVDVQRVCGGVAGVAVGKAVPSETLASARDVLAARLGVLVGGGEGS